MWNEHMDILSGGKELHCGLPSSGVVSLDRSGTLLARWRIHATTNEYLCLCSKIIQDSLVQATELNIKIMKSKMFQSYNYFLTFN